MYKMVGMKHNRLPFLFSKLYKLSILFLILLCLVSCTRAQTKAESIKLSLVAEGLSQPVDIANAGDERLFIVEKEGRIKVLENGKVRPELVLDLSSAVTTNSERGLLGLAFHPDFNTTNYFFVNYTDNRGRTVISRFTLNNATTIADAQSEKMLLRIPQPYSNHNGGQITFGPDGYLYIATGDGGSGGDPLNAGQDLKTHLGKILRIDVNTESEAYKIPADNPFVNDSNVLPEIWSYGLRNPWRMSFDSQTGDLFIADVGQNAFEEVNFQTATSQGGENYGWRLMEANACYLPPANCNLNDNLVLPILEYAHGRENGRSITGGYVYRGAALKSLQGKYIYGDFVSGNIWQAAPTSNSTDSWQTTLFEDTSHSISTFGVDFESELSLASFSGQIY